MYDLKIVHCKSRALEHNERRLRIKASYSFILYIKGFNSESPINKKDQWEIIHNTFCLLQRDFLVISP